MQSKVIAAARGTATTLALSLLLAPPASAAADEPQVRVEKIVKRCDGSDCEEHREHRVKRHKVVVGGDGGEHHKVIFVGDDGEVRELDGHHAVWSGHGEHKGGFLGVGLTELTPELRTHFGVPGDAGVMVSKVFAGSAAEAAGVQVGDIITLAAGDSVTSARALGRAVGGREPGETIDLEAWRDGRAERLTATLGESEQPARRVRKEIVVECDDEGGCDERIGEGGAGSFDCGGAESCEVRVECRDGGCDCTVNGEATDCAGIPGVPGE